MATKGIAYLRRKLASKKPRIDIRYKYYDMKMLTKDLGISTPPALREWNSSLGWAAKGVDCLSDRLVFREFRNDNFGLNEIYNMNNRDVLLRSAMHGALITSCDFIYISEDESGYPRLQVIDGGNATGEIDPITNLLTEGYAVLQRNPTTKRPEVEAYFVPGCTYIYMTGVSKPKAYQNKAPYPLLVPVIYKPDSMRPFGHSRITRAGMSHIQGALRTIKRSEIAAEFYSFPQKYISGLAEDAELDKWQAAMSFLIQITKDEDGDKPTVGQFTTVSQTPHLDQLKMFASLFAGETGLTLDDMGFPQSNPSSEEAIKAAHENLKLAATSAKGTFGTGFLNAGYLAACVRDNMAYQRDVFWETSPRWYPTFEVNSSALSSIGDAIIKINQAAPGFMTDERIEDLLGV